MGMLNADSVLIAEALSGWHQILLRKKFLKITKHSPEFEGMVNRWILGDVAYAKRVQVFHAWHHLKPKKYAKIGTDWHSFMEYQHGKNRPTWILCRRALCAWRRYVEKVEPTGNYLMKRMLTGLSAVLLALAWKEWAWLCRCPTTKYQVKLCEVRNKLLATNVF